MLDPFAENLSPLMTYDVKSEIGYTFQCVFTGRGHFDPERELMAATLKDALWTIKRARQPRAPKNVVKNAEGALEWVSSEDYDWIFSFVSVCEALGLEAGEARARILQSIEGVSFKQRQKHAGHRGPRHRI